MFVVSSRELDTTRSSLVFVVYSAIFFSCFDQPETRRPSSLLLLRTITRELFLNPALLAVQGLWAQQCPAEAVTHARIPRNRQTDEARNWNPAISLKSSRSKRCLPLHLHSQPCTSGTREAQGQNTHDTCPWTSLNYGRADPADML